MSSSVMLTNLYRFSKKIKNSQNKNFNGIINPIAMVEQSFNYYQRKFPSSFIFFRFRKSEYRNIFKYNIFKFKLFEKKLLTNLYISDNFLVKNLEFIRYRLRLSKLKKINFKKLIKLNLYKTFFRRRLKLLMRYKFDKDLARKYFRAKIFILRSHFSWKFEGTLAKRSLKRKTRLRLIKKNIEYIFSRSKKKKKILNRFKNSKNVTEFALKKINKLIKKNQIIMYNKLLSSELFSTKLKKVKRLILSHSWKNFNKNRRKKFKERKIYKINVGKFFFSKSKKKGLSPRTGVLSDKYKKYYMNVGIFSMFDLIKPLSFNSVNKLKSLRGAYIVSKKRRKDLRYNFNLMKYKAMLNSNQLGHQVVRRIGRRRRGSRKWVFQNVNQNKNQNIKAAGLTSLSSKNDKKKSKK